MPRKTTENRGLKLVLAWALRRDNIADAEIASALGKPAATYSRRKDAEDFPTYEELELIGDYFSVNPRWLQVQFGYLDSDELKRVPAPLSAQQEVRVRPDTPSL